MRFVSNKYQTRRCTTPSFQSLGDSYFARNLRYCLGAELLASVLSRKFVDKFRCRASAWTCAAPGSLATGKPSSWPPGKARRLGSGGYHGETSQHSMAVNWAVFGGELMTQDTGGD